MDVLPVLVLVLIGIRLLGLALYVLLPRPVTEPESPTGARASRGHVDPCLGPVMALPPEFPPSPESDLLAGLASGAVSRRQYRDRMAELAARDDEHRHLEAPLG